MPPNARHEKFRYRLVAKCRVLKGDGVKEVRTARLFGASCQAAALLVKVWLALFYCYFTILERSQSVLLWCSTEIVVVLDALVSR